MIKEALTFWNPWWITDGYTMEDVKERSIENEIGPLFRRKEVLVLTGVRRSGKTSMMYLIINDIITKVGKEQIMYVNLEDPSFEQFSLDEIYQAYLELMLPEDEHYLFLDEIQNKMGWEKWVKKIYDLRKKIKITVTGSNSSLLKTEFSSYLAGRNLTLKIFPLTFSEYLSFLGLFPENQAKLLSSSHEINHFLDEYMNFGGYPEVVLEESEKLKIILLKEYFSAILNGDVIARYNIKNQRKLERLAVYFATNISSKVSARSLSKIVDLNIKTVQEYMSHLENVYLFFFVNHFSYSLKQQYTYPRKVYCVDVGLKNAVGFNFNEDKGSTMENVVYLKLRQMGEVYYWKERDADIDFVLKDGNDVKLLVQSCYDMKNERTRRREVKNLLKAMDHFGLKEGIIITRDLEEEIHDDDKMIRSIPIWKWLLL